MNVTSVAGGYMPRRNSSREGAASSPDVKPGDKAGDTGSARPKHQAKDAGRTELSAAEQKQLDKLKARDREVHAHEAAHLAAAGGLAQGGASFSYQRGPNGQLYAVGGEVGIDISPVPGDPEATLRKAEIIRRAAMAPAQPSSQDRAIAAQAGQMESAAQMELLAQRSDRYRTDGGDSARTAGVSLYA